MTQLLALAMLFALWRYLRIRNKPTLPPTYTVTPWDEFRSRVCEATGRSTVAGNPEVTEYPGGWLVWEDLAHQVTDAAMPLEEALERGPCSPGEHDDPLDQLKAAKALLDQMTESPTVGDFPGAELPGDPVDATVAYWLNKCRNAELPSDWAAPQVAEPAKSPDVPHDYYDAVPTVGADMVAELLGNAEAVNRIGYSRPTRVLCEFSPEVTLTTTGAGAQGAELPGWTVTNRTEFELAPAGANSSPWIGRRVWAYGRDAGVVTRAYDGTLFTPSHFVNTADAELHWDDVRAGDVAHHDNGLTYTITGRRDDRTPGKGYAWRVEKSTNTVSSDPWVDACNVTFRPAGA